MILQEVETIEVKNFVEIAGNRRKILFFEMYRSDGPAGNNELDQWIATGLLSNHHLPL